MSNVSKSDSDILREIVKKMEEQENVFISTESEENNENDEKTMEQIIEEFPGYPKYEERKHCGCQMTYYPEIDTYFWGEWEFQPCMPIFVIFLIVSSFIIGMIFCFPQFKYELIIFLPLITFFGILFLISYIQIIKIGPGYFPFYWGAKQALKSKNSLDNQEDEQNENDEDSRDYLLGNKIPCPKDGIMTNVHQYSWAHQLKRPERSVLARSARRIVLRPDHLCGWTTVWIGKRNHKLFILFNLYGFIYLTLYSIYMIRAIITMFSGKVNIAVLSVCGIYTLFALSFDIMTCSFVCSSIVEISQNITSWEEWSSKESAFYNRGSFKKNMEDVFGPYKGILNWLKPTSPFEQFSNEELANQYLLLRNEFSQNHNETRL